MENSIETLIGKTLTAIDNNHDQILFTCENGDQYQLFHSQDCCENVSVEDIVGDLSDLIGVPILKASEISGNENPTGCKKEYQNSYTWTFYNLATIKGYVTIRWYGESNGCYSESVQFDKI